MKKFYRVIVLFIFTLSIFGCYTLEEALFTALDNVGITPPTRSPVTPPKKITPKDDSPTDTVIEDDIPAAHEVDDVEIDNDDVDNDDVDNDDVDNRRIVTDISITEPFFSHYNLAKTEEFEPNREYTLRVEVEDDNAIPWGLTLYIQEEADSDYFLVIDFTGTGVIREQTISTEKYQNGDEIEYYWEIELPGDSRRMRYGDWEDGFLAFDIKE